MPDRRSRRLALERSGTRRPIVLGDLIYARISLDALPLSTIQAWRERRGEIEMLLVSQKVANSLLAAGTVPRA